MKALKLYTGSLIIICIAVLSACTDNFSSSPVATTSDEVQTETASMEGRWDSFASEYILEPGEKIFLDSSITQIKWITAYSVSNCNNLDLFISASNIEISGTLDCSWRTSSSFNLADLSIENISNRVKKIKVTVKGFSHNN